MAGRLDSTEGSSRRLMYRVAVNVAVVTALSDNITRIDKFTTGLYTVAFPRVCKQIVVVKKRRANEHMICM